MPAIARIVDPAVFPVVGSDDHLPAIGPEALTPEALRLRFANAHDRPPEFAGDGRLIADRPSADAAVLLALIERDRGLQVLLTRRTAHLRSHAGQISFPGGRSEGEDEGPIDTALRETEEEVGLLRDRVEVIGGLARYTTVTNFVVTPVVALVRPPLDLRLDPFEVAEAFEVPLAFLMNPAHHRRHRVEQEGVVRHFLSMPWTGVAADGQPREYFIWGATAAMLRNLYSRLAS